MSETGWDTIELHDIVVERDGRFMMRWKCTCEMNGVPVRGWGPTAQASIRDALNFRIAEKVIKDFKSSRHTRYRFGGTR